MPVKSYGSVPGMLCEVGGLPFKWPDVIIPRMQDWSRAATADGLVHVWFEKGSKSFRGNNDTWSVIAESASLNHDVKITYDPILRTTLIEASDAGVPALYYSSPVHGMCLVSTDLKLLVEAHEALGFDSPGLSLEAVGMYLSYQYIPAPWSPWCGVKQLLPGNSLKIDDGGQISEIGNREFRPAAPGDSKKMMNEETLGGVGNFAVTRIAEVLRRSIAPEMSVGVLLSGGMDTSTNGYVLRRLLGMRPCAYTATFPGSELDEWKYASVVAKNFGFDHIRVPIKPGNGELIPALVDRFDSPNGDRAAFAQYLLYDAVARRHDVLVTGEGGDEVMGWPRSREGEEEFDELPWDTVSLAAFYLSRTRLVSENIVRPLFDSLGFDPSLAEGALGRLYERYRDRTPLERMYFGQWRTWMTNGVYAKDCQLVRGIGLRLLIPFMDGELMQWMAALSSPLKWTGLPEKTFMKVALSSVLPSVTIGKRKQKFWLPMADWMRGPWRDMLYDSMLSRDSRVVELFGSQEIRKVIVEHDRGVDLNRLLWALLVLEFWLRGNV